MDRRRFLLGFGAVGSGLLAGCSDGGDPTDSPTDISGITPGESETPTLTESETASETPTPTETETATQTTTEPTTQEPENLVEISRSDYILANSVTSYQDNKIPWGVIDIENISEYPLYYVQIQVRFYDEAEELLEERRGNIDYVPAETTWRYYQRYYTETPEKVDSVETRIVGVQSIVTASTINGEILNSNLDVDAEGLTELDAEIEIGDTEIERLYIIALLYDGAGRVRGSIRETRQNPPETVAISGGTLARTPPELDDAQVNSFEIFLFTSHL